MKPSVFVDTSAWKAFVDAKDKHHQPVREVFDQCRSAKILLETTDYILSETLTLLRIRAGHAASVHFGRMIHSSQVIQVHFVTTELFQKAWEIFQRYSDKDFSFVDCASFAFMQKKDLKRALTLDIHFSQFGFECLPVKTA